MLDLFSDIQSAAIVSWHALGAETKAAIIGALATFIAAFAGFGAVIWQMRSQGRQARAAIIETERRKLKANMYEQAVSVCRELADTSIDLSTQLRIMMMEMEVVARANAAGLGFQVPSTRFPRLADLYAAFSDAALRFVFLVENRRIVDPRIIIFRTAFNALLHDARDLMNLKFVIDVMPALPTENAQGQLFPYTPPSIESALAVGKLAERFIDSLSDAIAYTEDFLVEMQNRLLGDLFQTELIHREPIDPAKKVIRLDQADALEAWFEIETDWGKECARIEAETRARFTK